MRPSISGSATFIARSRGPSPRVPARQLSSSLPAKTTCSTGQSAAARGSLAAPGRDGKPGRVQDHRGRRGGEHRAEQCGGLAVLQTMHEDRQRPQTPRREGADQRVDRCGIARLDERPVEDDRHDAAFAAPLAGDLGEARQGPIGPVEPGAQQRGRLGPIRLMPDQRPGIAQQILGIRGAAFDEIAPQPVDCIGRQGR